MKNKEKKFSIEELCSLVGMSKRRIRYYIQNGLVDRPHGTGKGAHYSHLHLEQLLTIRKWKQAGLSLERIRELIRDVYQSQASDTPVPPPQIKRPGDIEVWSHLHIQEGVELHIESQRSNLTPEQVRGLCREVIGYLKKIKTEEN